MVKRGSLRSGAGKAAPAKATTAKTKRPAETAAAGASPAQQQGKGGKNKKARTAANPTVEDIQQDNLTPLANLYWAPGGTAVKNPFNANIIEDIYKNELKNNVTKAGNGRLVLLELSSYLENYLWKNFDPKASTFAHLMSLIMLINEKFRQNLLNIWDPFHSREEAMQPFLQKVLELKCNSEQKMTINEKACYLQFLINCFQSLEDPIVRDCCLRLTSPILWQNLSPGTLKRQVKKFLGYKRFLKKLKAKGGSNEVEKNFLPNMITEFFEVLKSIKNDDKIKTKETKRKIFFCERFLEFMIDLLSQLPTRRFFLAILTDVHFAVTCDLSELNQLSQEKQPGHLFNQLVGMFKHYMYFEIDEQSGEALTDDDIISSHYMRMQTLQQIAFKKFQPEMLDIASTNISAINTREGLSESLSKHPDSLLRNLCQALNLVVPDSTVEMTRSFLISILVDYHEKKQSRKQQAQELPLYPTEGILWDENLVPSQNYEGYTCLALPKLNLQFLTFHDYLLRNFNLYRLESTYEIRDDLVKTVLKLKPQQSKQGETIFGGYATMAVPIYSFAVKQVKKPNIGEIKPALVRAEVTIDLSPFRDRVRQEWEELREHDVLFLLTIQAKESMKAFVKQLGQQRQIDWSKLNEESLGIKYVRGCEVKRVLDEEKKVIGERDAEGNVHRAIGNVRTFDVFLDSAQYQTDMSAVLSDDSEDPYTTFNLLVRRKAKENNFKAVLKTVRDLMNTEMLLPDWLHDVFLGYGDPYSPMYYSLPSQLKTVNFYDTFLDEDHIRDSFPGQVDVKECSSNLAIGKVGVYHSVDFPTGVRPDFNQLQNLKPLKERTSEEAKPAEEEKKSTAKGKGKKGKKGGKKKREVEVETVAMEDEAAPGQLITAELTRRPPVFGESPPKRNAVRFTPVQVEAIKSGVNPGLTMIVGPPGTGKTDTAVQIMSELYQNYPEQRTLIITHSNQALNDLFEKIMERDIDERYLLRLGRGQEYLESDKDFSKFGRVNHMLARRIELLDDIGTLARSLGMEDDVAHTCETAGYFFLYHILSRWELFLSKVKSLQSDKETQETFTSLFPFTKFFSDLNNEVPIFKEGSISENFEENMDLAEQMYRYLTVRFDELEETRPFELLRTGRDRGSYLLTKHAKIIAMTCTHAAINRPNLLALGFQYDNLVMEEAGQILEIETFIPMLLQQDDREFGNRLKRVILLGDHHQLPPVIKNRAFQKFCRMDQSMFARFVRLGMPYIQLNAQGRMRPSLASLWNWKYDNLKDLSHVKAGRFAMANAGLAHDFQAINVEDYNGIGESCPQPFFFQNLGEAESVVQMYMYMRLVGIKAHQISIITTYNGQKALIRDIVAARCNENPLYGPPAKITTVDKFQGQQNDFVLVSLVRTKHAGHIRDVRRLVVAMSRSRLGLYVFGRVGLFESCFELARSFSVFAARSHQLQIVPQERTTDGLAEKRKLLDPVEAMTVENIQHLSQIVTSMADATTKEWVKYEKRVKEFEDENARKQEVLNERARQAREARDVDAKREALEMKGKAKAEEYAKQSETFFEETSKIVEAKEGEAEKAKEDEAENAAAMEDEE